MIPPSDNEQLIATLRHFSREATAMLTDLTEARPLIRTMLYVKTLDGRQQISGLVCCAVTFDFLLTFVRRFSLSTRKSKAKTIVRLANGQRVTSSKVCDITFEHACHKLHWAFYVLRDLRVANLVIGLPWLDDEQASLQFGTTRAFTLMDGTLVETHTEERLPECLLMSFGKIHKLMRKTRRSRGRNAEFYVINLSLATE
jgi:hypothetical protein